MAGPAAAAAAMVGSADLPPMGLRWMPCSAAGWRTAVGLAAVEEAGADQLAAAAAALAALAADSKVESFEAVVRVRPGFELAMAVQESD